MRWILLALVALVACDKQPDKQGIQVDSPRLAAVADTTKVTRIDSVIFGDTLKTYEHWTRDSAWVWRKPVPVVLGIPFGPKGDYSADGKLAPEIRSWATLGHASDDTARFALRLKAARAGKYQIALLPAGGARANYQTNGTFDMAKWKAKVRTFASARAQMDSAYKDGTLIGASLMDEPYNRTGTSNDWHWAAGTDIAKAVDGMCRWARDSVFGPKIPVGVLQDARFGGYTNCDFIVSQYRYTKDSLLPYRDKALKVERETGTKIAFAINVLDGGKKVAGCPVPPTGGTGATNDNCRMSPEELKESGVVLGSAGCFLTGFVFDPVYMSKPANKAALEFVAGVLKTLPRKSCKRGV